MSPTIVNLTLSVVTEEVEIILSYYAQYPYQKAFADQKLRQKLIAYVLSRVPNQYTVREDNKMAEHDFQLSYCSVELQLKIEKMIHQGIINILQENVK